MNFEINKNDDGNFMYNATYKIHTQIVNKQDEATLKAIYRYCEENNVFPNIIDEDKLKLILQLGIQEYNKKILEGGENNERKKSFKRNTRLSVKTNAQIRHCRCQRN